MPIPCPTEEHVAAKRELNESVEAWWASGSPSGGEDPK